jgi:hypothetical protein
MSINVVLQSGIVKNPALRYSPDGKPEFRFTLLQQDGDWPLYLPCCAVGSTAERLASELDEDMAVVISSAKLCYRKRGTKAGEQSRMEILVWSVEPLTTVPQGERPEVAEDHPADEPEPHPEPKVRRRSYPNAALKGGFAPHPN